MVPYLVQIINAMVYQVTTREFRDRQKSLLDMVDKGANVVIRRSRGGKAYAITPIDENDLYFSPEMLAKIDKAVEQVKNGEVYAMNENESLDDFLDRVGDEI